MLLNLICLKILAIFMQYSNQYSNHHQYLGLYPLLTLQPTTYCGYLKEEKCLTTGRLEYAPYTKQAIETYTYDDYRGITLLSIAYKIYSSVRFTKQVIENVGHVHNLHVDFM